MGLFRGAVFRHGGGARKQPIKDPTETPTRTLALMGRFLSLMGRFPSLMGRFTDFVLRGRFTSWKSTGKQPINKRGIKRFLKKQGSEKMPEMRKRRKIRKMKTRKMWLIGFIVAGFGWPPNSRRSFARFCVNSIANRFAQAHLRPLLSDSGQIHANSPWTCKTKGVSVNELARIDPCESKLFGFANRCATKLFWVEENRYKVPAITRNASEMRQKYAKMGLVFKFGIRGKLQNASKMRRKCAEHLWGRTPFGRYRESSNDPKRSRKFTALLSCLKILHRHFHSFAPAMSNKMSWHGHVPIPHIHCHISKAKMWTNTWLKSVDLRSLLEQFWPSFARCLFVSLPCMWGLRFPRSYVSEVYKRRGVGSRQGQNHTKAYEQRHLYANKAATEVRHFLSETPPKRDTRLENDIGNCQNILEFTFLKYLKNKIHAW